MQINNKLKNKVIADRNVNEKRFKVGEQVQLLNEAVRQGRSKNLGPQWLGPFVVIEVFSGLSYKIKKGRTTKTVHENRIKSYYD